jgi:group I intron endonuclease
MVIYKTTNLINGKIYIGQNQTEDSSYLGSGKLIKRAIKKNGRNNFKREVIEICNIKEELDRQEKYWIEKLQSRNPDIGYNLHEGGEGGNRNKVELSQATKNKMSKSKKGKSWGHHTEKTKYIISQKRKGISFSEEHKKHISEKRKLRKISQQTREKQRKSMLCKNIKQYLLLDPKGQIHITKKGLREFCRQHRLNSQNLHQTLTGKRKTNKGWKMIKRINDGSNK